MDTMIPAVVPRASLIFIAREAELARLSEALSKIPVALICGLPGVGKSSVAYAVAERWQGPVVYRKAASEPLSALLDDMRRQLARGAIGEVLSEEERLLDLASRLEQQACLWVLDDLHLLEPQARGELFGALTRLLRRGRALITSRERLSCAAGSSDWFELLLDGLDKVAAQTLWRSLDALYGPANGFEKAWSRCKGNPFQLRRAHAGGLEEDDPVGAAIAALQPDELLLVRALALSEVRLPVCTLEGLLCPDRTRAALRRLTRRLIADVDGYASAGLHDLFREAVLEELGAHAEQRREIIARLARLLPEAGLDPVVLVREMCRHLCSIQDYAGAGQFLLAHAADLVRNGATAELLRAVEAIPRPSRSAQVRLTRARCFTRLLDLTRGYEELEQLVSTESDASPELKVSLAQVAMATGRLDVAERLASTVLADAGASRQSQMGALLAQALVLTHRGMRDDAQSLLISAEARAATPLETGLFAAWRALSLWLDDRCSEAESPMRRARALLADAPPSAHAMIRLPIAFGGILARIGHFEEANAAFDSVESGLKHGGDLVSRVYLRGMRATLLYEQGKRLAALRLLSSVADDFERGGHIAGTLWAQTWIGRIMLLLGKRREGAATLENVERRARGLGLVATVRAAERARAMDLVPQIQSEGNSSASAGPATRMRGVAAIRAAAAGDAVTLHALIQENAAAIAGEGFGLDRALVHVALALIARVQDREDAETAQLEQARQAASADQVDADLIPSLIEALGRLRLVTRGGTQLAKSPPKLNGFAVVLDGRNHELKLHRRGISLRRRPLLRRFLYALAARPQAVLSKEVLAERLWSTSYNPLLHDNPLWVNTRRLRRLLERSGLVIESVEQGYRLSVPEHFLFIDPGWSLSATDAVRAP
jgi:hypothetical protein